ncbi:hypothetical protein CCR85_01345 [Rhodothalassium salexigens]|uniref:HP1 family phage holin n=1 Tax=Rhodothalassium salexigens TaxID=1086 RepID=UPI001911F6F1|nr:HP1 family phage holin [Rhodothalassium salexigens]MBK5910137.1 hypothetical protein [Rhodothalassium salexigens]MBK5920759.1 hypothetical protein [Rhodothalassium salexigens]
MELSQKTAEQAAYATSACAIGAGLTLNEWAAVVGIVLAVLTFVVNLTFKVLHYQLAMERRDEPRDPD